MRENTMQEENHRPGHLRKAKYLAGGVMLAAAAAWFYQNGIPGDQTTGPDSTNGTDSTAVSVVLVPVKREAIFDTVEALGTAQANESVTLMAKVSDTVSKLHFEDGDVVEKDVVLMELSNTEQSAFLDEARINYEDARSNLKRIEDLGERGNASESAVDEARARASGARARRDAIVARLEDRVITAPFSGVLGFRQVSQGTLVTPGTPITTLDDISVIKLDFSVPSTMLADISPGNEIIAESATWPEHPFPGIVSSVGSRIDPVTRSAMVRALIQNEDGMLHPGMLLTVELLTKQREALTLPEETLQQTSGRIFVYVVDDEGKAQRQYITLARRLRGKVVIAEGLEEGELVISEGTLGLFEGATVVARNPAPLESAAAPLVTGSSRNSMESTPDPGTSDSNPDPAAPPDTNPI
jgi:membrane fusion protein (multidrug efflux system)